MSDISDMIRTAVVVAIVGSVLIAIGLHEMDGHTTPTQPAVRHMPTTSEVPVSSAKIRWHQSKGLDFDGQCDMVFTVYAHDDLNDVHTPGAPMHDVQWGMPVSITLCEDVGLLADGYRAK